MDTRALICFCKICETRSINQAARQLYITPQGLSRIVRSLEQELGTRLLERDARGVEPTESGRFLYEKSGALLASMEEVKAGIRQLGQKDRLQIGYACGVLNTDIFTAIQSWEAGNEGLQLFWEEDINEEIKRKINGFELDVGFVVGGMEGEIFQKKLVTRSLGVLVYPGHPFYERDCLGIEELQGEKLLTLNERFYCCQRFVKACDQAGFVPDIVLKTMDSRLLTRFCQRRAGLGIDVDFGRGPYEGEGLRMLPLQENLTWSVYGVCRKENQGRASLRQLFSFLEQLFPAGQNHQ